MMTGIAVIGTGNMGGAVALALARRKDTTVCVYNRTKAKAERIAEGTEIRVLDSLSDAEGIDTVILAVKPQVLASVYAEAAALHAGMYISLAAGVTLCSLEKNLGTRNVVRFMPNIAASVGTSVTAVTYPSGLDEGKKNEAMSIAGAFGSAFYLDESLFNAFIGISGSAIAYVFEFMHSLALGGVREGMSYSTALNIVSDTLLSAVALQKSGNKSAIENEIMVCSPRGTTIEGLKKLKEFNFENSVIEAVSAASRKAGGFEKN